MRLLSVTAFAILLTSTPAAHACNDHDPSKGSQVIGRESAWVVGEVREVYHQDATITLGHAKIPALKMEAMSAMMFKAASPTIIASTKPGDKVRFRARLVNDQPTLTRLTVVTP